MIAVESELRLQPLRDALVARAHADADRLREEAAAEGRRQIAAARAQVASLLSAARAQGEAEGAELRTAARAEARRTARTAVLGGQRTAYDVLRTRAGEAVRSMMQEPAQRAVLVQLLRTALGEAVALTDTADGGMVASTPDGRSIDASVSALVDRALADLDLEPLWTAT